MAEQDLWQAEVAAADAVEPGDAHATAGARLRHARERLSLKRSDVAARTKIAERHLAAIEEDRLADLASSTYAVGFSRAYARAVGLDERAIAQQVRGELDLLGVEKPAPAPTFEPGDPARVPTRRTAWLAGAAAVAVIAGVFAFWNSFYSPAVSLPDLAAPAPAARVAAAATLPPVSTRATNAPVVVTATQGGVWVKITDAAGTQLLQKEMAQGESFTIPAQAADPQLRTARPEALAISVGGRPVAALSGRSGAVTVPVSAAALLGTVAAATPVVAPAQPIAPGAAPAERQEMAPVIAPQPTASARPTRASATPAATPPRAVATPEAASAEQAVVAASPAAPPPAQPARPAAGAE